MILSLDSELNEQNNRTCCWGGSTLSARLLQEKSGKIPNLQVVRQQQLAKDWVREGVCEFRNFAANAVDLYGLCDLACKLAWDVDQQQHSRKSKLISITKTKHA